MANILLVDDEPANLLALRAVLEPLGQRLVEAHDGDEALKFLLKEDAAVVLLDVEMPGLDGFQVAGLIRGRERSRHVPIVFLTAHARGEGQMGRAYAYGAIDYVVKPLDPDILRAKVSAFVDLHRRGEQLREREEALHQREQDSLRRQNEAQFRTVLETIPQLVSLADRAGLASYCNQRWVDFTGQSREALITNAWAGVVHPEDLPVIRERWRQAHADGTNFEVEFRARRRDGVYRWLIGRFSPLRDAQGQVDRWFGTSTDIDDQKREREIARFLAEASTVLSSSLDYETTLARVAHLSVPKFADWCTIDLGVDVDSLRTVVTVHSEPEKQKLATELAGKRPATARSGFWVRDVYRSGKPLFYADLQPTEAWDPSRAPEGMDVYRSLGLRSCIVVPLIARGQAMGTITFVTAESARHYTSADVAVAEDLARRAAAAMDNARLYGEAQQAIQLRDEFLSVASHELKTPLTPIQLKLQVLLREAAAHGRDGIPPARMIQGLEVIRRQVGRLTDLVNGLLDVSRISAGRMELDRRDVDLSAVAREVVTELAPQAAQSDSMLRFTTPGPVVGHWDPLRLEQVVSNLISNAIKYGPGKPIEVSVALVERTAVLRVQDQGIGIEPEHLARIFGRFERAVSHRNYGGLGLGLYISRQIVEALGGEIRVTSALHQGSLFEVRLPLGN